MEIRVCKVEGCEKPARYKGRYANGTRQYGTKCMFHHKRFGNGASHAYCRANEACSRCGWDKAPCDRHRIIPELGYSKENTIVLCPNCHREGHL